MEFSVAYFLLFTISKKRLGHVTSPELKMAGRDLSISHCTDFVFLSISTLFWIVLFFTEPKLNASFQRRRLRKSWEWARYDSYSDHFFSIGEWPLQMPQQEVFSLLSTLAESFAVVQQPTSNHFQCNFEFKANCQSDLMRNPIRPEQSYPGFVNGPEIGVIHI